MDFSIPLELSMIQDSVREFVERHLRPLEREVDEADDIDPAVMQELRGHAVQRGIYGFNLPEELGGGGVGPLGEALIGEATGSTSMPLAEAVGRLPRSLALADADQREWLVGPALRGERTACVALTEPEAGSDLSAIRTHAVRSNGGWALSGSKHFISNAETSDYILVLAVTDPAAGLRERFSVFVVDRNSPGLEFTHRFKKMGWHGYHISSFSLDDVHVGEDRVLGGVGTGFDVIMASVNTTRLYIAGRCVGAASTLLDMACEYAANRKTFGKRLGDHQAIQFMIADMEVEVSAAQMLLYAGAWESTANPTQSRIAASKAKLYASEMAGRVADKTLQIFGGAGFMCDLPIERLYRDLRGYRIGEGSSEMQRIQIARHRIAK
jgi:acyl-CoA dehydrogenase